MVKAEQAEPLPVDSIARGGEGKRTVIKAVATGLQFLATVVIIYSILWILSEKGVLPALSRNSSGAIPQSIGGYELQRTVTGQKAIDDLTAMHGKDVELSEGWIGYYEGDAIVWYTGIVDQGKAAELIARMTAKIAAGNATFTNLREFEYAGITVYSVVGQNQLHLYYQVGSKAIWLAAPHGSEEEFLKDAMRLLK